MTLMVVHLITMTHQYDSLTLMVVHRTPYAGVSGVSPSV